MASSSNRRYEVMSHIGVMSRTWMSHVAHMDELCHTYKWPRAGMGWLRSVGSIKWQVSFEEYRLFHRALLQKRPIILSILLTKATPYQVMSHVWRSHVTHMNESCRTYEWVVSHILISHVAQMNSLQQSAQVWSYITHMGGSYHTYEWVMSHTWMNHVTHINGLEQSPQVWSYITHMGGSRHTYEWIMSHIWMSHVTHINDLEQSPQEWSYITHMKGSRHTYEWVVSHIFTSHESCRTNEWPRAVLTGIKLCHTYEGVTSHICVRADSKRGAGLRESPRTLKVRNGGWGNTHTQCTPHYACTHTHTHTHACTHTHAHRCQD